MPRLKKILRLSARALLGLVIVLVLYGALIFAAASVTIKREACNAQDVTIYIKTNGVHTDIVVPARSPQMDWTKEFRYSNTGLRDTTWNYLALGWGDKGFYLQTPTWADLKASVAFKAAFGLSSSAIHATYYRQMAENADCRKIQISREQYDRLIGYVLKSLKKDAARHAIYIPTRANYGISDAFYEANGRYSLFYTCNTWANSGLKTCGQTCCLWTLMDKSIFEKYK